MLKQILLCLSLAIAGCGGGSGGDGGGAGMLTLTLSPNPLTRSLSLLELPATLPVAAVVGGSTTATQVFAFIEDPAGTFAVGQINVFQTGQDRYTADLVTKSDLSVGPHRGTLRVILCGDSMCNSRAGSASLPYDITVRSPTVTMFTPSPFFSAAVQNGPVLLSVRVEGLPQDDTIYASIINGDGVFASGRTIAMTVNNGIGREGVPNYDVALPTVNSLAPRLHTGSMRLLFCGDSNCQSVFSEATLPFSLQVMAVVAGKAGMPGAADGNSVTARFNAPGAMLADASGNTLVVDSRNSALRRITAGGAVTFFPSRQVLSPAPFAIARDSNGNTYFGNEVNDAIGKIALDGSISTFSGLKAAGLAADSANNIYASNPDRSSIAKISQSGQVSVLSTNGTDASLNRPTALVIDQADNVFAICAEDVVKITPSGTLTRVTRAIRQPFNGALDLAGNLLVTGADGLYRIAPDGEARLMIPAVAILEDRSVARPLGVAQLPNGAVILADNLNHLILSTTLP